MYQCEATASYEMYSGTLQCYNGLPVATKEGLRYLAGDTIFSTGSGGHKFGGGGIYWTQDISAIAVLDRIYIQYKGHGDAAAFGVPREDAVPIVGGLSQQMQHATLYYRTGAVIAHEVKGDILQGFLASGGKIVGDSLSLTRLLFLEFQYLQTFHLGLPPNTMSELQPVRPWDSCYPSVTKPTWNTTRWRFRQKPHAQWWRLSSRDAIQPRTPRTDFDSLRFPDVVSLTGDEPEAPVMIANPPTLATTESLIGNHFLIPFPSIPTLDF